MRKGSAGSSRGVERFADKLVANLRRAGAAGPTTMRGDSGFWSQKLIDRLDAHDFKWSITVALIPAVRTAIQAIPNTAWTDIAYTNSGHAQVAETQYTTGRGKQKRTVRLVVRRTRLTDTAQQRLWPDWRHHAFNANTEHDTAAADRFHRGHAVVELAIRDLKEGTGLEHVPSGHYGANCAPLACAVLAHNIGHPTNTLADAPPATNRSRRTRLVALAAVLVNRSGTPTLRYPARWPWETQFRATLSALRALPGPSGSTAPPGTDAPTQTQRRQPQTTPPPLAEHAQTHQTAPPTTRRDPNPPPTRESRARQRPIGGFRLRALADRR